jgi:hypothetical protein
MVAASVSEWTDFPLATIFLEMRCASRARKRQG